MAGLPRKPRGPQRYQDPVSTERKHPIRALSLRDHGVTGAARARCENARTCCRASHSGREVNRAAYCPDLSIAQLTRSIGVDCAIDRPDAPAVQRWAGWRTWRARAAKAAAAAAATRAPLRNAPGPAAASGTNALGSTGTPRRQYRAASR